MALNYRTKLGTALAVGVVVGLMSFTLSVMLLAVAAFLVAWGREPSKLRISSARFRAAPSC
jgi:hypothetical protein